MPDRRSVGFADLGVFAQRLADGTLPRRPGSTLEISKFVWDQNSFETQQAFEAACRDHGVSFAVVDRIGGIEWVG